MTDISAHLPGMLLAWSVFALGVLSPGPSVLAIMGTSLEHGRKPGVFLAGGVVSGSAFWGTSAALGMSAVLTRYAGALTVIKIIGGLYLLWLAFKALRTAMSADGATDLKQQAVAGPMHRMWRTGFLIHLTNPKAVVTWIATIALGVSSTSPPWVSGAIALGGVVMSLMVNVSYALLFSSKPMARLYLRAKRPVQFVFAGFFGVAGIKLLTAKI